MSLVPSPCKYKGHPFGESVDVQDVEHWVVSCIRFLTTPDDIDGAYFAKLDDSLVVARKAWTGPARALHGAWTAGLNEFPSSPMQRAKIATQSPADDEEVLTNHE